MEVVRKLNSVVTNQYQGVILKENKVIYGYQNCKEGSNAVTLVKFYNVQSCVQFLSIKFLEIQNLDTLLA